MERTETQMKILEVGKKEFLEKGFKDASLNRIVAEAGFTKGAFYGYYPDKAALLKILWARQQRDCWSSSKPHRPPISILSPRKRRRTA